LWVRRWGMESLALEPAQMRKESESKDSAASEI
jgi:hypothetical protein